MIRQLVARFADRLNARNAATAIARSMGMERRPFERTASLRRRVRDQIIRSPMPWTVAWFEQRLENMRGVWRYRLETRPGCVLVHVSPPWVRGRVWDELSPHRPAGIGFRIFGVWRP